MIRTLLLAAVLLFTVTAPALAQDDMQADSTKPAQKPLMLTFGLDVALAKLGGGYMYDYKGEYHANTFNGSGWQWVDHKTSAPDLVKQSNYTDIKLMVLGAGNRNCHIGLSFNFGYVGGDIVKTNYDTISNPDKTISEHHDISFTGICLAGEYDYYFNKESLSGFYALGAADVGFYTGTDEIFGPGTPFYLQGKLGLGYNVKNNVQFRVFLGSDQLLYTEHSTSQVFQRQQTINAALSSYYISVGISRRFTIFQD